MFSIDATDYTVVHEPDVLGLMEPVSGVLFLNVSDERFDALRRSADTPEVTDPRLTEVFWHEAHHCFQTYTTGYLYEQCLRVVEVLGKEYKPFGRHSLPVLLPQLMDSLLGAVSRVATFPLSQTARDMLADARSVRIRSRHIERLSRRSAEEGQPSMIGATNPGLHPAIDAVKAPSLVRGDDGLSAHDVMEGAAFVYGRTIVSAHAELVDPGLDPDGPYQRLVMASMAEVGPCPPMRMLAASALALRYEHPGDAFLPVLRALSVSQDAHEIARARRLAEEHPAIPGAGRYLGTALEVHRRTRSKNRVYEEQMESLGDGRWGIDGLELLADVEAISYVPRGKLGFTVVTRGGRPRGPNPASVVIAWILLPNGPSVAALRRGLRQAIRG
jgi:hypothetical protein